NRLRRINKLTDTTGFSRWCFNFTATTTNQTLSDTTRLQPVVLQFHSYNEPNPFLTPPGFSRWYFNFTATTTNQTPPAPPAISRWSLFCGYERTRGYL